MRGVCDAGGSGDSLYFILSVCYSFTKSLNFRTTKGKRASPPNVFYQLENLQLPVRHSQVCSKLIVNSQLANFHQACALMLHRSDLQAETSGPIYCLAENLQMTNCEIWIKPII